MSALAVAVAAAVIGTLLVVQAAQVAWQPVFITFLVVVYSPTTLAAVDLAVVNTPKQGMVAGRQQLFSTAAIHLLRQLVALVAAATAGLVRAGVMAVTAALLQTKPGLTLVTAQTGKPE